jgi:regulator of sigma E protease
VNGVGVSDWYGLMRELAAAGPSVRLEATRPLEGGTERVRVELAVGEDREPEALGMRIADSEVRMVEPGSPADQAGVESGDLILSAHGSDIESFADFAETIRAGAGAPMPITLLRTGRILELDLLPEPRPIELDGELVEVWAIGVHGGPRLLAGEIVDDVVRNPFRAAWVGTQRTAEIFSMTLLGISKLITGEVSLNNVAGPIGIGKIAADSYAESWFQFFWVMAVISVNLAILNLLPIPILDGGQIVFALAEGIKGAPLSLRVREVAQQVGLSLLILLMGFAFWNDLSRYWSRILGFFEDLV